MTFSGLFTFMHLAYSIARVYYFPHSSSNSLHIQCCSGHWTYSISYPTVAYCIILSSQSTQMFYAVLSQFSISRFSVYTHFLEQFSFLCWEFRVIQGVQGEMKSQPTQWQTKKKNKMEQQMILLEIDFQMPRLGFVICKVSAHSVSECDW